MDWDVFGSALNAFNNTLTNSANVIMASQTDRDDRNFSREMSDLAWKRNIEAWNMQNEYNLPINQYKRQLEGLRYNGLNPNLVYGNSSSVTGAAGAISPFKFENFHSTAVPRFGMVSSYQDMLTTRLLQTQVGAQEAQNRLINARADNEEARLPGTEAKANEAATRWNMISNKMFGNYEEALKGTLAKEYWTGVRSQYDAERAEDNRTLSHYEAVAAEWLNTELVPGTNLTYRQYMDQFKAMIPAQDFERLKKETLDIVSRTAYRDKQGEMLDLKMEYQRYVNYFARYGRTLGNDWLNLLFAGIMQLFGEDPVEMAKKAGKKLGEAAANMPAMPPTYPGP